MCLVSSTAPASAKNSLFLEIANLIKGYSKYPSASNTKATIKSGVHFFTSLLDLLPETILSKNSQSIAIAPIYTTAMSIKSESLLIIWVSSCAATDSISDLLSFCKRPLVNTIRESEDFHPSAKAFIAGVSIIPIFGTESPLEIQRFSTIL